METQILEISAADGARVPENTDGANCDYCGTYLPQRHFVSGYKGHYCNEDCHRMYTED